VAIAHQPAMPEVAPRPRRGPRTHPLVLVDAPRPGPAAIKIAGLIGFAALIAAVAAGTLAVGFLVVLSNI
jgi:hypothetical protein